MPGTKRAKLADWVAQHHPAEIGLSEFELLKQALAPISESYLRKLILNAGVPLAPMVAGVRQSNLEELERTLLALLDEYESGDAAHRLSVRKLVITAKDHAKWTKKDENLLWLTTWLENPPLFPAWVKLRCARAVTPPSEL
jgi:hypothetical protein